MVVPLYATNPAPIQAQSDLTNTPPIDKMPPACVRRGPADLSTHPHAEGVLNNP